MARRRQAQIAVAAATSLVLVLLTPAPVSASNWGGKSGAQGCNGINQADNKTQTYYLQNLEGYNDTDSRYVNNYEIDQPTSVSVVYHASETSQTDVVVYDLNYVDFCGKSWHGSGGSTIGLAICVFIRSLGDPECMKHEVRFDTSWTSTSTTTENRILVLHEFGHALGLQHTDFNDVMQPGNFQNTSLSTHDINHIDGQLDP